MIKRKRGNGQSLIEARLSHLHREFRNLDEGAAGLAPPTSVPKPSKILKTILANLSRIVSNRLGRANQELALVET